MKREVLEGRVLLEGSAGFGYAFCAPLISEALISMPDLPLYLGPVQQAPVEVWSLFHVFRVPFFPFASPFAWESTLVL